MVKYDGKYSIADQIKYQEKQKNFHRLFPFHYAYGIVVPYRKPVDAGLPKAVSGKGCRDRQR